MSKIVCEVCGTSFPETSAQCPICGYVPTGDNVYTEPTVNDEKVTGSYTYVKGGRFSKNNVRKRNKGVAVATTSVSKKNLPQNEQSKAEEAKPKNENNKGLLITIGVLIVAILAVLGYIVVKFLLPGMNQEDQPTLDTSVSDQIEETGVPCTDILLNVETLMFDEYNQQKNLDVNLLPSDTTDSVSYLSKDETVAVVDTNGLVTAVGRGETSIIVICGAIQVECAVVSDVIPPEAMEFRLNRQQITFDVPGAGWLLYSGEIPVEEIIWTTEDEMVATVEDGRVTAVGEGYTKVYGEYLGNQQVCEIVCLFTVEEEDGQSGNGNVTEEGTQPESSGEYHLDNLYSIYDTNVTLSVGEWFPLRLVDENGNQVDAVWSVQNGNVCKVNGGDVTALARGETYIIATYNGQEYQCYVCVY